MAGELQQRQPELGPLHHGRVVSHGQARHLVEAGRPALSPCREAGAGQGTCLRGAAKLLRRCSVRGFGGMSNYPPGHPTGTRVGESGRRHINGHHFPSYIYECEHCCRYVTFTDHDALRLRLQYRHGRTLTCPKCNRSVTRAHCDTCEKPATHIDEDRAVNFFLAFCDDHFMGQPQKRRA